MKNKSFTTSVTLPIEYRERINNAMEEHERPMAWIIRKALDHFLSNGDTKKAIPKAQKKTTKEPVVKLSEINLPRYIDPKLWDDFLVIRKRLKAPATERAHNLLISKLESMYKRGYDPNEAIRNSIENGWKGVFEPKTKPERPRQAAINNVRYDPMGRPITN